MPTKDPDKPDMNCSVRMDASFEENIAFEIGVPTAEMLLLKLQTNGFR